MSQPAERFREWTEQVSYHATEAGQAAERGNAELADRHLVLMEAAATQARYYQDLLSIPRDIRAEAAAQVAAAWNNPGPAPMLHYGAQQTLADEWPRLADAVEKLAGTYRTAGRRV